MHTYESGHYLKHSRVHGMIKVHSNWSVSILHVFHFYPPPGHLRHVPQPPTHPCDFHSPSFLSLSSILCCTSFSLHPCLLTPSLIFHSHSAALRLIHKQHHSLQRQKVERGGEGGMEGGLPLLTYWLLHAEGSLKPANPEAERRGGYGGERECDEGRLMGENPSASNYTRSTSTLPPAFIHSSTATTIHSPPTYTTHFICCISTDPGENGGRTLHREQPLLSLPLFAASRYCWPTNLIWKQQRTNNNNKNNTLLNLNLQHRANTSLINENLSPETLN